MLVRCSPRPHCHDTTLLAKFSNILSHKFVSSSTTARDHNWFVEPFPSNRDVTPARNNMNRKFDLKENERCDM